MPLVYGVVVDAIVFAVVLAVVDEPPADEALVVVETAVLPLLEHAASGARQATRSAVVMEMGVRLMGGNVRRQSVSLLRTRSEVMWEAPVTIQQSQTPCASLRSPA